MTDENDSLKRILEGALLAVGETMSIERLQAMFDTPEQPEKAEVLAALKAIQADHETRGFNLVEVASGWRFQVCPDLAPWVNRLWDEKPQKYSRALLETLSLIAYRQPLTRGDIEEVRGVAVSSHIVKTLAEREWIKVVGHRDVPGRPSLYATTRQFLDYFGLKSLDELPSLGELKDIDSLNTDLNLDATAVATEQEQIEQAKSDLATQEGENMDILEPSLSIEQAQVAVAQDEIEEELTPPGSAQKQPSPQQTAELALDSGGEIAPTDTELKDNL